MLPSLVVADLKKDLKNYICSEFPIDAPGFIVKNKSILEHFLDNDKNWAQGPWLEVQLPFKSSDSPITEIFDSLAIAKIIPFAPYEHQLQAFKRLRVEKKSTLIATGTGSGKTECFLMPILDHCLTCNSSGIKAILIYPMNALASDQASRIEALLKKLLATKKIRAGIYTGDSSFADTKSAHDGVLVKDRVALLKNPPDILITNYKMLDFLLMRPEEQDLWKGCSKECLQYLVVDELHTFDGAQGTDLACLIRRLRARLNLGDELVCVGTSATLGGKDHQRDLIEYARQIFDSNFDEDSIVKEQRLSAQEYLESFGEYHPKGRWPSVEIKDISAKVLKPAPYFEKVVKLWFGSDLSSQMGFSSYREISDEMRLKLGQMLPNLQGFRSLIEALQKKTDQHEIPLIDELALSWSLHIPELITNCPRKELRLEYVKAVIDSLVAMISLARVGKVGSTRPFLNVRCQLWMRAISRAVASLSYEPELKLKADISANEERIYLPIVMCRECGRIAWLGALPGGPDVVDAQLKQDFHQIYGSFFSCSKDILLIYPVTSEMEFKKYLVERELYFLCPSCGRLEKIYDKNSWAECHSLDKLTCNKCHHSEDITRLIVRIPNTAAKVISGGKSDKVLMCPCCQERSSLRMFGFAEQTISAALIDELHASAFSEDHKLIAFSDSVQDAALRAGFWNARGYLHICRQALKQSLKSFDDDYYGSTDPSLSEVIKRVPEYWLEQFKKQYIGKIADPNVQEIAAKAAFISTFIATDMQWLDSYRIFHDCAMAKGEDNDPYSFMGKLVEGFSRWRSLYDLVSERLCWEVFLELGYRSENGRTLLRNRDVIAYVDTTYLKDCAENVSKVLLGKFKDLDINDTQLEHFILGILRFMKLYGAFDAENLNKDGVMPQVSGKFAKYQQNGDDYMAFNTGRILPRYGRFFPPPSAVTYRPPKDKFTRYILPTKGNSRFTKWAEQCFNSDRLDDPLLIGPIFEDLFDETMRALEQSGYVRSFEHAGDVKAYVLCNDRWKVSSKNNGVTALRCSCCKKRFFVASEQLSLWLNMPCLNAGCSGKLTQDNSNFIQSPVFKSAPIRINAYEHSSLIDSSGREDIERSFKDEEHAWKVNLLSATPTLEMGIDIGDLSTVLLSSMPPKQSGFLQRIGRAGRRDGNALAITLADRSPHAQYFWETPNEMLCGAVSTPGVFLKAVAVLERQLTAFAISCWVLEDKKAKLSMSLKDALKNLTTDKKDQFPLSFLEWVSDNKEKLFSNFISMFKILEHDKDFDEMKTAIYSFLNGRDDKNALSADADIYAVNGQSVVQKLRQVFESERNGFEDKHRRLTKLTSDINKASKKEALDEYSKDIVDSLKQEKAELSATIKSCYEKKTLLNFLTDEGFLPNYAFPEEGVQVHSVITKYRLNSTSKATDETKKKFEPKVDTFDFSRAAGSALKELSPDAKFYANGHVLRVDQLTLGDTKTTFEKWRFCPNCSYAQKITEGEDDKEHLQKCPRCGSSMFGDSGQVKNLIKVREITATANNKLDQIDDSKEHRTNNLLSHHVFIDIDPKYSESSWVIADNSNRFGFEYVTKAVIREINFGKIDPEQSGEKFKAGGCEYQQHGFKICKGCGRVFRQISRLKDVEKAQRSLHDSGCRFRDPKNTEDHWIEGLFLYREMKSEAVRIRLPGIDLGFDQTARSADVCSFVAAIKLGLRRHFNGAVDHLKTEIVSEPASDCANGRVTYLVIYDTIPGGSGYLKDLSRVDEQSGHPENMIKLFHQAYEAVRDCECAQDDTKDGCYHCVYQYSDAYQRQNISRSSAERVMRNIVSFNASQYKQAAISSLKDDYMSELEKRFIPALSKSKYCIQSTKALTKDGKECWQLTFRLAAGAKERLQALIDDNEEYKIPSEDLVWIITPQIDINDQGRNIVRPDFMITPHLGVIKNLLKNRGYRETAYIFTDGWGVHKLILADDSKKRQYLLNKGFLVWSFVWQDFQLDPMNIEPLQNYAASLINTTRKDKAKSVYVNLFGKLGDGEKAVTELLQNKSSSLDRLIAWMCDPVGFEDCMKDAVSFATLSFKANKEPSSNTSKILKEAHPDGWKEMNAWFSSSINNCEIESKLIKTISAEHKTSQYSLPIVLTINDEPYGAENITEDQELHQRWIAYWQLTNVLQFADEFWACTTSNQDDLLFKEYRTRAEDKSLLNNFELSNNLSDPWQDLFEMFSEDEEYFDAFIQAVSSLDRQKLPVPIADLFDVVDGEQGLKWELNARTVFLIASDKKSSALSDCYVSNAVIISTADDSWQDALNDALLKSE